MQELTIHHIPANEQFGARVRVSYRSPDGAQAQEQETDFGFTVTEQQRSEIQWYLEEYLIYPWGEFEKRAQGVEKLMVQLGTELFDTVFSTGGTRKLYARVEDNLPNTRIIIHANDPEGIALPWELMRDSAHEEYGDLARLAYAFARSQPNLLFQPPSTPTDVEKFNILMIICRPGGPEGDVPFQSVARPLLELFRDHRDRIRLDILRPPTFEQLARVLNDKPNFYHVLHFDGHGAFPQGAGTHGLLLFEGENDEPRRVTGAELGSLLAGKGLPVVLLNACQSGMTHPEAIYPSVGNELLKAGTRGVVAMAYSVYVQSAVRFMARLYESLVRGEELARAVAVARDDLRSHPQRHSPIGEIELQDWIVPVLFEAAPVKATSKPLGELRLNPNILKDKQAEAGALVDLPEPPAFGFVGRDGVTLDLERAFRTETIVLLEGMAGVGKTEMAAGFARWWAETGALDGPSFFFRFEHYLPLAQVCDRVGQIFGEIIRQQLNREWHLLNPDQKREIALSVLKQVPCMLIWDNFEPVAGFPAGTQSAWKPEEQKELRDFLSDLRGGRTRVLITSRRDEQWLGNIYRCVPLGGLKLTEAQELAVRILKRAGLNPQQIKSLPQYNELLKYLRGNPLAIQAILPELKRTRPDTLLQSLRSGEVKLSADDPAQGRERSLSASLNYRLDALDPQLRQHLGVLALFQGFVNADVLAGICQHIDGAPDAMKDIGRDEWVQILNTAAEVGLLRRLAKGYYTVHPALPWFFYDLLHESFPDYLEWLEQAFSTIYGSYGWHLAEMFKTNTETVISLLRAEEGNLTYALHLSRRHELWSNVEGILYGLRTLFVTQGRWVEWKRLIAEIEDELTDEGGEPLEGRSELWLALLGHKSEIANYRRDFSTEQSIHLRLKEHYELIGDNRNVAVALHQLGILAEEQRRFDEAEKWYQQSLEISGRIGNEYGQSITLHQLGVIAYFRRQFDEAENWYRQSLEITERIGDEQGQSITLHQLGIIAHARRQFDKAEQCYQESLEIKKRISNEQGQAITLHQLGRLAEEQKHFDEAERWYRQTLIIDTRIGDEHGQAITLHQLGRLAEEQGNTSEAIRFFEHAEALFARLNDEYNLGIVRSSLERVQDNEQGSV